MILTITIQFIWPWVKLDERDVKQRLFGDTLNVDITDFDRDLYETLDSLQKRYWEWNVNEKCDFIVRSTRGLADTHMHVRKYTRSRCVEMWERRSHAFPHLFALKTGTFNVEILEGERSLYSN